MAARPEASNTDDQVVEFVPGQLLLSTEGDGFIAEEVVVRVDGQEVVVPLDEAAEERGAVLEAEAIIADKAARRKALASGRLRFLPSLPSLQPRTQPTVPQNRGREPRRQKQTSTRSSSAASRDGPGEQDPDLDPPGQSTGRLGVPRNPQRVADLEVVA